MENRPGPGLTGEMIGFDAAAARLTATVLARERVFQVQAELFRDRRRKLSVNKVPAKNSAAPQ